MESEEYQKRLEALQKRRQKLQGEMEKKRMELLTIDKKLKELEYNHFKAELQEANLTLDEALMLIGKNKGVETNGILE